MSDETKIEPAAEIEAVYLASLTASAEANPALKAALESALAKLRAFAGFTQEDVDLLHQAREALEDYDRDLGGNGKMWTEVTTLAAKIAAVLPKP
jgi:hypothetical protein